MNTDHWPRWYIFVRKIDETVLNNKPPNTIFQIGIDASYVIAFIAPPSIKPFEQSYCIQNTRSMVFCQRGRGRAEGRCVIASLERWRTWYRIRPGQGDHKAYSRNEKNSSLLRPACSRIARRVPFGIVFLSGTTTSLLIPGALLTKALWPPFPLLGASSNPALRRALISSFKDRDGSFFIEQSLPDVRYTFLWR